MQELNDTAHRVLDVAEQYTQTRGFNAFSYKDIQKEVGVKTSSIHYYFPTKQDLAMSMTDRYVERFRSSLKETAREQKSGLKRLETIGGMYVGVLNEGKFCMCGMLASDMLALPEVVHGRLCEFFRLIEEWVADAIEAGKEQNEFKDAVNAANAAAHFLAALEGGMLIARVQKNPGHLEAVVKESLSLLKA